MNYLNLNLVPGQNYLISEGNFGTIRYGDLIAISTISKALRQQYKDNKFYIFVPDRVRDLIDCVQTNFDGYFTQNYKIKQKISVVNLPISCNCWGLYNYLYYNFKITPTIKIDHILKNPNVTNKFLPLQQKISHFKNKYNSKTILFIPLFSTPNNHYNHDRFFPIEFCINLINEIQSKYYTKYYIILCGHHKNYFFNKLKKTITVKPFNMDIVTVNNIMETIYLMTISDYYIGGDTGTSHIVANLKEGCNNLIFLYGSESSKRHQELEKNIENIITIKKNYYNMYKPMWIDGKNVLYLEEGFDREVIDKVVGFLK